MSSIDKVILKMSQQISKWLWKTDEITVYYKLLLNAYIIICYS